MRRVTLAVVLAALTAGAQVARADMSDGLPLSRKVSYSDLNLASPAGAQALYRRLTAAADVVCAPFEGRGLVSEHQFKACVGHAIATAVADVNSPLLTSYYQSKVGVPHQQVAQLIR
jgi:UrcA family protein